MLKVGLVPLLILALAAAGHAGGLFSEIDAYVELKDARRALGDVPGVRATSPRYAELCRLEAAAREPLSTICAGDDDLAGIVRREMAHRLAAQDAAVVVAVEPHPLEAVAGEDGALLKVAPRHDASAAGVLSAYARLHVTGRAGDWYQLTAANGVRVFAHGSLLDVDLEEEAPAGYTKIADQKPTYYNTTREAGFPAAGPLFGHNYTGNERKQVRTTAGAVIATTSGRYFASLCMEGSGILSDGRGVSFVKNQRFQILPEGCKGITATGRWVVPFHTLAVNKREMAYGGVYFVPRTKGLTMPSGEVHDGFWFAHDTGSAFSGTPKHRTDMYTDESAWVTWMELNHAPSFSPIAFYRVDAATAKEVYEKYKDQLGR